MSDLRGKIASGEGPRAKLGQLQEPMNRWYLTSSPSFLSNDDVAHRPSAGASANVTALVQPLP